MRKQKDRSEMETSTDIEFDNLSNEEVNKIRYPDWDELLYESEVETFKQVLPWGAFATAAGVLAIVISVQLEAAPVVFLYEGMAVVIGLMLIGISGGLILMEKAEKYGINLAAVILCFCLGFIAQIVVKAFGF